MVLTFFSALPFLAATPAATFETLAILSLPSFSLTMATFEGSMGIWYGAPLALFLVSLSIWMTHFFLNTWMIFPLCPLWVPLKTTTSSSFLTGSDLRPCFFLRSFERVADMMVYLMWEGAEKWALLDFLLELVTYAWVFICGDYKLYLLLFVYSLGRFVDFNFREGRY